MKNTFAVIGLGTFGFTVAEMLSAAGHTVVAVDRDRGKVEEIKEKVSEAIIADASVQDVVRELDIGKFDSIIVGMSSHFENAVMALALLKQERAKNVIMKANTQIQKKIFLSLGADEVILPDHDIAERLSKRLSVSHISDMFKFKGMTIAEVIVRNNMDGYSLKELDLRNKHNLSVLMIRRPPGENETVWNPNTVLHAGDELTVIGQEKDIINVFKD